MASINGPVLKMECPSFFYHYGTFTSFKMEKVSTTAQTAFFFFFSFVFLSQDSMHRIIQLEYSISTLFTKVYMV